MKDVIATLATTLMYLLLAGCAKPTPPPEPPPAPPPRPEAPLHMSDEFDADVRMLKSLDYQSVDLAEVDARTMAAALTAMNDLMTEAAARAKSRIGMLTNYIRSHDLGARLAASKPAEPVEVLGFHDGLRIAVAYVRTPMGAALAEDRAPKGSDEVLKGHAAALRKLAESRWEALVQDRRHVEAMAQFLLGADEIEKFLDWARTKTDDAELRRAALADRSAVARRSEARVRENSKRSASQLSRAYRAREQQAYKRPNYGGRNPFMNTWTGSTPIGVGF